MSGITELVNHIRLPRFVKVHQYFPHTELSPETNHFRFGRGGLPDRRLRVGSNLVSVFVSRLEAEACLICPW